MTGIVSGWTFTSYSFWVFLGIILLCHWLVPARFRNWVLLIGSYIFYASWDWRFILLILLPTGTDFFIAERIAASNNRQRRMYLMLLSIFIDCGILGFFKYNNFFVDQIAKALHNLGLGVSGHEMGIFIPIGISYFLFTSLGYVFDVYRRKIVPTHRLQDYALFIVFFPKLIAGPIERAKDLLPQITGDRSICLEGVRSGLWFVLVGLFSKLVIADGLTMLVNGIFTGTPSRLTGLECWTGAYAYTLQLYCDFWGYSSIAVGVSRWMGFQLTLNFRMPYFSKNPSEFWSRWHISLSTWLRDYVFLPLDYFFIRRLGSRRWFGLQEEYWAYFGTAIITMLLAGLWHGTGWTFVIWGLCFGLLLCIHRAYLGYRRLWGIRRIRNQKVSALIRTLVMFHFACLGWVIFRSESIEKAWAMLVKMFTNFGMTSVVSYGVGMMAILAGPFFILERYQYCHEKEILRIHWVLRGAVCTYIIIMIVFFSSVTPNEFIYFRF